jgi:hypothetical protein
MTYQTRFTVDDEPGRPRLRRGLYLLSAAPQTWLGRAVATWASGGATGSAGVLVSFEGGAA